MGGKYNMNDNTHRDELIAYLTMIQGVISRMANNAFLIKGWSVTLWTAVIALSGTLNKPEMVFISIVPLLFCGWLDSYFFAQERNYRELYVSVVNKNKNNDVIELFDLRPPKNIYDICFCKRMSFFWERAVFPLYIFQMVTTVVLYFLFKVL
jgi:hypothetical protein